MVSIVIPVWNQVDYTVACLESIANCTPEPHEIIVVDNGSTDGTKLFLAEYVRLKRNMTVIENERNLGFPVACNQGIAFSKGEHILLLNNDVVVSPEWLKGMLECMAAQPDYGVVGPRTNSISGPQQFTDGKYSNPEEFTEFAQGFRKTFRNYRIPFWRIVGFCMLIKREVIEKIGTFDERFSPGNFEDDDFCLRSILAGYRNVICGDVFVHHHGSASHRSIDHGKLLEKNQEKFIAKWKGWQAEHSTISCCMIVKNEEKNIGNCLTHIVPLVDEVVVVDTGSTDRTKEIAATFPKVKLYDFPWVNDFSKARNFANQQATGDWIFSLDADEVIESLDRGQLFPGHAIAFETRNYTNSATWKGWRANTGESPLEEGIGWFPSIKIRLFPNDKRIFWQYPVHEVLEPSVYDLGLMRVKSEQPIHHTGKVCQDIDIEKGKAYYAYLQQAVEANPDDVRHVDELATQAQNLSEYDKALELWQHYLSLDLKQDEKFNGWLNLGHCLASLGRNQEALEASRMAWKFNPDSREAAMNTGVLLFRLGFYESALKIARTLNNLYPEYPLPVGLYKDCVRAMEMDYVCGGI